LKSNFFIRTITAAIFAAILIGGLSFHAYTFCLLSVIIISLGMFEFFQLIEKKGYHPQRYLSIFSGIMLFMLAYLVSAKIIEFKFISLFFIPIVSLFIAELYRKKENPFTNLAYSIFGIIYIAVPFALMNGFVFNTFTNQFFSSHILLGFIFLIWINDSGAYLSGMTFGKHKLFERISPKKTWEGSIGGAVFTFVGAWVISLFFKELSLFQWLFSAPIIIFIGTYGDLAESLFKRSIQIKDSGTILPGHGGMLDRFDSLMLALPVGFVYLQLLTLF